MTSTVYKTGTVTVAFGDATVTGSGTAWEIALVTGGMFSCGGLAIPIEAVVSDTEITLADTWPGSSGSGLSYAIALETSEAVKAAWTASRLADALRRFSLSGFAPEPGWTGTETQRDLLDLGPSDEGKLWGYLEIGNPPAIHRWSGSAWQEFVIMGADGLPGAPGINGSSGILMTWDTGTSDADPGNGKIRANNASLASATYLYIDDLNRGGSSIAAWVAAMGPGTITITDPGTNKQAIVKVTAFTDASGYSKLTITGHSGETAFANSLPVTVQYSRDGNSSLSLLDDTDIDTPADEDALVYDGGESKWVNRPLGTWIPVSVISNEATIDLADGDRFIIDLDDDCELQVPDNPRTKPFAIRIVCSGAGHTFTFAEGWLGDVPAVLDGDGDETILSGIILDTSPSVTAIVNLVKAIQA